MMRWAEVIAEDLGTVPPFLRPSLETLGVPGYRVLRWEKDEQGAYRDPATWPEVSVCTNATHDTDTTATPRRSKGLGRGIETPSFAFSGRSGSSTCSGGGRATPRGPSVWP
jgi:hypothetical protein